ncbi:hypothetical protein [Microbacterium sp. NPDC055455]
MAGKGDVVAAVATAKENYDAAIKALSDAWPGEDATETEGAASTVPVTQASDTLKWARKKYDSLVRWVVGVFSAIGLLVFGSVPFVNLAFVDVWRVSIGLVLSGIGLAIVIYATTRALEPEDASLSELRVTIKDAEKNPNSTNPRTKEAARLNGLLSGDTAAAFGPGINSVDKLLEEIGRREAIVLHLDTGWSPSRDAAPPPPQLANVPSADIGPRMREHVDAVISWIPGTEEVSADAVWNEVDGEGQSKRVAEAGEEQRRFLTDEWHQAVVSAVLSRAFPSRPLPTPDLRKAVQKLLDAVEARKSPTDAAAQVRAALLADTSAVEAVRLKSQKAILDNRLWHRNLVLDESGVSQLRATFRVVRRLLMIGAALVLIGGVVYAWAVTNPKIGGLQTPVSITINPDSDSMKALVSCGLSADEGVQDAAGTLISIADPGDPTSEAKVLLAETACAGATVKIASGDGRVALAANADPAATEEATDTDDPGSSVRRVASITITAGTDAWAAVDEACELSGSRDDDISVQGYVRVDGEVTGLPPFSAEVICDDARSLVAVEFAADEGTYSLP